MDIRKLQRAIVDGLEDVKAQNIVVFNTEHLSPLFERVIVASGTSNRQTKALAASVRDAVKASGLQVLRTEGEDNGEWIIVDCGAAVAHIMQPGIREYYHLEEIWGGKAVRMKIETKKRGLPQASEDDSLGDEDEADEAPAPKAAAKKAAAKKAPTKKAAASSAPAKSAFARQVNDPASRPTASSRAPAKKAAARKTTASSGTPERVQKIVVNDPAQARPATKKVAGRTVAVKTAPARKTAAPAAKKAAGKPAAKAPAKKISARHAGAKKPATPRG